MSRGRAVTLRNQVLADQLLAVLAERGPSVTREIAAAVGSIDRWVEHICFDGLEHRHEGFYRAELLECVPTGRYTYSPRDLRTVPVAAHRLRRPCYPQDIYPTLARLERAGQVTKSAVAGPFRTVLWSAGVPGPDAVDELERLWALS